MTVAAIVFVTIAAIGIYLYSGSLRDALEHVLAPTPGRMISRPHTWATRDRPLSPCPDFMIHALAGSASQG